MAPIEADGKEGVPKNEADLTAAKEDDPDDEPIVKELKQLDDEYLKLEREFEAEERALRAKFRERQAPLLQQRADILAEPSESKEDAATSATPVLRGFWCQAIANHPAFSESPEHRMIKEWDEPVLAYLKDITTVDIEDEHHMSFRLDFIFSPNPYFEETVLTKTYVVRETNPWNQETEVTEVKATPITWKPSQDITVEIVKKKVKGGGAKKAKQAKEKLEPRNSFFRDFLGLSITPGGSIPAGSELLVKQLKKQLAEEDGEESDDEENVKGMMKEKDFELGTCIKDNVIPYAVRFYTGEASCAEGDEEGAEDQRAPNEGNDQGDDDDDDESEEDEPKAKPKAKGTKQGKKEESQGKKEECKQQ